MALAGYLVTVVSLWPLPMEFILRFKQEDKYKISCCHFVCLHGEGVHIFQRPFPEDKLSGARVTPTSEVCMVS